MEVKIIADPQRGSFQRVIADCCLAYRLSKRIIRSPKAFITDVKRYAVKASVASAPTTEYLGPEPLNLETASTLASSAHLNVLLPAVDVKYMSGGQYRR
jgi:hypothetical protein